METKNMSALEARLLYRAGPDLEARFVLPKAGEVQELRAHLERCSEAAKVSGEEAYHFGDFNELIVLVLANVLVDPTELEDRSVARAFLDRHKRRLNSQGLESYLLGLKPQGSGRTVQDLRRALGWE